jgi:predicted kinase
MGAKDKQAGSGIEIGDHVFATHPERGPVAVRVVAKGKDGFMGHDGKTAHGFPTASYLGHKARVDRGVDVLDTGADGMLVRDHTGATRYLATVEKEGKGGAGETYVTAAQDYEGSPNLPDRKTDDPLLGGLKEMRKALGAVLADLDAPPPRMPVLARAMFFKADAAAGAGGIANRPGLALEPVTDKLGHQTKRWERTDKGVPGEQKPTPENPTTGGPGSPMKHGDKVGYQHGLVQGEGHIVASGLHGVTLRKPDGTEQAVRHEHLTGPVPGAEGEPVPAAAPPEAPPATPGGAAPTGPVDPEQFSAASFARGHDDAAVSPESVLASFPPDTADRIRDVEADIAKLDQTIDAHKKDGKWTPERVKLHQKIVGHILSEKAVAAATPAKGQRPTFTILGGRGGSGKSWFAGKVYDPAKAIVLDADEIKQMLPEYKGWNAAQVHEESGDIFDEITRIAHKAGLNIVHDATLKTGAKATALVKKFKESGYRVEAHYMHLPRQEAAKRAVGRFLGKTKAKRAVGRFLGKTKRYVPPAVILSNTANEANFDAIKPMVDAWSFRDNNVAKGAEPRLISEKKNEADGGERGLSGLPAADRDRPGRTGTGPYPRTLGTHGSGGFPPGYRGAYEPARDMEKAEGAGDGNLTEGTDMAAARIVFTGAQAPDTISGEPLILFAKAIDTRK